MKIAICDDELRQLENISDFITLLIMDKKIEGEIVCLAKGYKEMEDFINSNQADLYILDIDLKDNNMEHNGYSLAEKIRSKSNTDIIIFQTGLYGYMQKGYDVNAFHFLTKPIDMNVLEVTLVKANELYNTINATNIIENKDEENLINVMFGGVLYRFSLEDIIFVEKLDSKKIKIKLNNGKLIESTLTLSDIEEMCAEQNIIVKSHKSFMCNIRYVKSIDFHKGEIIMKNGDVCLLGRTFKDVVMGLFGKGK